MTKLLKINLTIMLCIISASSLSFAYAAEQVFFYHTDPAGNVVWRADYKPFGEENTVAESQENDKRFIMDPTFKTE